MRSNNMLSLYIMDGNGVEINVGKGETGEGGVALQTSMGAI